MFGRLARRWTNARVSPAADELQYQRTEAGSAQPSPIERSDELLRLAVQVGGIGIYETDFDENRARFSPELCDILGLPAGTEMTYADALQLFDKRDRAAVTEWLPSARVSPSTGDVVRGENLLQVVGVSTCCASSRGGTRIRDPGIMRNGVPLVPSQVLAPHHD